MNAAESQISAPFSDRLLESHVVPGPAPFLTVAIPHYKHRRCLEVVLASLFEQSYDDFEIIVSDDCSPDDSNATIPPILGSSGRRFRYYAQPTNLGYDGNVRFLLAAACGRFVLFLGNDDALAGPQTLRDVARLLHELGLPQVAVTNVRDWQGGRPEMHRAPETRILGSGPDCAVAHFRSFSFVGGLIYDAEWARRYETDRWDKSVYYQIYIASRIIAAGGAVAALDYTTVAKDVRIDGQTVPNAVSKLAAASWSFKPRHTGLDNVIRVTVDAILPNVPSHCRSRYVRAIVGGVYTRTYPYWLLTSRKFGNWAAAFGVARGMWPSLYLRDFDGFLAWRDRFTLWALWWAATIAGLTAPVSLALRWGSRIAQGDRR